MSIKPATENYIPATRRSNNVYIIINYSNVLLVLISVLLSQDKQTFHLQGQHPRHKLVHKVLLFLG